MSLLPLILAVIAFAALGLSTDTHHRNRFGRHPDPRRRKALRIAAWTAMALGFVSAVATQGWVFGPIVWTGTLMGGAAIAFLALNLVPGRTDTRR